ncbi:MAG: hypothetical protein IT249_20210 [Chitinophagaceae bacterium]|nr:hypothetical protein [Chitinophagaceae bacterium]
MITLLWLTISTPFIIDAQKKLKVASIAMTSPDIDQPVEDCSNPFSGLNEERGGSSANALSEYLHEHFNMPVLSQPELVHENHFGYLIYVEYYGELLSPPPEA